MISLSTDALVMLLFGCAMLSSLITVTVVALAVKFRYWPKLERDLDDKLERAADRLEERLRQRLVDLFTGKSRDLIAARARDLARLVGGGRRRDEDPPES